MNYFIYFFNFFSYSFTCNCEGSGYEGTLCSTNINECNLGIDKCADTGQCVDQQGNYTCLCSSGYTGRDYIHVCLAHKERQMYIGRNLYLQIAWAKLYRQT